MSSNSVGRIFTCHADLNLKKPKIPRKKTKDAPRWCSKHHMPQRLCEHPTVGKKRDFFSLSGRERDDRCCSLLVPVSRNYTDSSLMCSTSNPVQEVQHRQGSTGFLPKIKKAKKGHAFSSLPPQQHSAVKTIVGHVGEDLRYPTPTFFNNGQR